MPLDITTTFLSTTPFLYWPLDGGGAGDSSGGAHPGTPAGDINFTVTGMEPGKTSCHLGPGSSILSPYLNLIGEQDFSMGLYASVQPVASQTMMQVMIIGTGSGSTGRGMWLGLDSNGGTTRTQGLWMPSIQSITLSSMNQPINFWHHILYTYTMSSRLVTQYIDGINRASVTITSSNHGGFITTDPLLIQTNIQMSIAHVALWPRLLTSSEITAIGSFNSQWPYQLPVYQQVTTEGGGLTEEQAEQLASADLNATNTAQVQIPALSDLTTTIQQAVLHAFQGLTGGVLQSPVGGLVAHPDPNLLHFHTTSFVLTGRGALHGPAGLGFGQCYAINWQVTASPGGVGDRDGAVLEYKQRAVQFVAQYYDASADRNYTQEILDSAADNDMWFWQRWGPSQILYDVTPGFELTCWYYVLII